MRKFVLLAAVLLLSVTFSSAQFTLTSIDYPGGTLTTVRGINNHGDIVGSYRITPPRHALLIQNGQFIPLAPETILGAYYSEAYKTNDRGDVVGVVQGDDGFLHGFLLRDGVLTALDFPGANETLATGINESGTVVGYWNIYDPDGNISTQHGFIWKDGTFTDVTFPGADVAGATGINARGDFVGAWSASIESPTGSAFVYSKGTFTSFDAPFPGVAGTQADDINAFGDIVGVYSDQSGMQHSFWKAGSTFTLIDYPDAALTTAWGINSVGQMVGNWRDASGFTHGWLAQPSRRCVAAPSDLIGWWPGDGNANDIQFGNDGTLMNGATFAAGWVKRAFSLDGMDDYVNVPDAPVFHSVTTTVTVDAWINPQVPVPPFGEGYSEGWIFARRDPNISEGISFRVNSDGYVLIDLQAAEESFLASTVPVIQYNGQWKHIALTADTATGLVTLYLNGEPVQLFSIWGPMNVSGQFASVSHLFIGERESEGPATMHYKGLIDEVQFFNRALAPSEILAIYQAGPRGECKH